MAWLILFVAGLFETGWAIGLKYTDGFTRIVPTLGTVVALVISLFMLSWSARELPIGTAYAVWVGIGAFGAAILGIYLFGEPATPGRLFFLALMLISIAGLKLTSSSLQPIKKAAASKAQRLPSQAAPGQPNQQWQQGNGNTNLH